MPALMTPKAPLTPAERVRERMERWLTVTGLSQREFAAELKKTQVWLQKVLAGENDVRLRHLDEVARAMRTTASELVREEDERYQLELTPTEVRIIKQLRRQPDMFTAIAMLLRVPGGILPSGRAAAEDHHRPHLAADRPRKKLQRKPDAHRDGA
jgi:transcriptional regulator with XRE-family HTH domain